MRRHGLIGLLALLTGCGSLSAPMMPAADAPQLTATSGAGQSIYYPMAEGLHWVYEDGPAGSVLPLKRHTLWFSEIRRGDEGSAMVGTLMRTQEKVGQVIHNNLGAYFAPQMGNEVGPRHILIQYPLLIGSGWELVKTPKVVVTAKIEGIETVRVPAGSFARTFRIGLYRKERGKAEHRYANRWLAPNVGLVQQYNYDAAGKVRTVNRLRQFVTDMTPTPDDIQTIGQVFGAHHFREFDVNKDGWLSPYEAGYNELFEQADRDGNGKLDPGEYIGSDLHASHVKRQLQQTTREFGTMDTEIDLELTSREATRQRWLSLPRLIRQADLDAVDADRNGRLNYREFLQLYRQIWLESLSQGDVAPSATK